MSLAECEAIRRVLPKSWQAWIDPYSDQVICEDQDSLAKFIVGGCDMLEICNEAQLRNFVQARLDLEKAARNG